MLKNEVVSQIERVWGAMPVPDERSLLIIESIDRESARFEYKDAFEEFGGKRFNELNCAELLRYGIMWLTILQLYPALYYAGGFMLCIINAPVDDSWGAIHLEWLLGTLQWIPGRDGA